MKKNPLEIPSALWVCSVREGSLLSKDIDFLVDTLLMSVVPAVLRKINFPFQFSLSIGAL